MKDTTLLPTATAAAKRGRSRSQHYVDIQRRLMTPALAPRPGRKVSVWPAYEIDEINRAEIAGASDDEIRNLVQRLIEQRTAGRAE